MSMSTCLWFLLVSSFTGANEVNVNCLRSIKSQVKDPKRSLSSLDLSRNNFSGALPSNIASLIPFVTTLDLSYNQFSGEIPTGLLNVTFLNTLMLQHNQFTGQLPPQLASLQRLKQFSVADNHLIGPVPKFNEAYFGSESFANNTDLCGLPMEFCINPEEKVSRFGQMGAAIGAAIFAPVGAFLGWFFFNGN
ncbi:probably inactive leucine-rich repeat receptor-like protein kinase At5g48380 [Brassica rapa]|uniref:probably inactive leucine-rich repeat receptor-like protein kinase At5g48380 n=1 Tax=Brassica napus TaxID=3708 RepID=UPI000BBEECC3|nr:probably inactive leucine-rich repeat receptor-like protein kinase At5g48380 [Brassica napus]XP_033144650.1 probably inactive leucine-rich repeat receptor-like protein kinase At5g48380 [Brassica rapa]